MNASPYIHKVMLYTHDLCVLSSLELRFSLNSNHCTFFTHSNFRQSHKAMAASTPTIKSTATCTKNVPIIELRKELNDKLSFLNDACQDNKKKRDKITKQDQYIQLLTQQLQRLQSLNKISTMPSNANHDNPAGFANRSQSPPNHAYPIQNNYNILNVTNKFQFVPITSNTLEMSSIYQHANQCDKDIKYAQDNYCPSSNLMYS